ncbi:urease accessory protein UreD [Methylobacterium sp. E-025]|uniref:urease accessory protein UreD n=1 Tax=Methylobacterium sp. E-025 TaxID=2836561 RepID=UPI001FBAAC06|nr:urease accessory protein UreD [Methylobacterium sp. E-025]MCJ2114628.1 urease accessory protein UreD [Methylobacterium sp. E-025]
MSDRLAVSDRTDAVSPETAPARQRSVGRVMLRVAADGAGTATRIADLAESGPSRLRFPRAHGGAAEAILVNTAGGIACGDNFAVSLALEAGAGLVLTTTAAEKIYRSDGPVSQIANRVALGPGARLAWLPQETIVFDRARLRRRFEADLAPDAGLLVFEAVAFGRAARGERVEAGLFEDVWRIRRGGRLVYADSLRLDGPIAARLARPAIGGGARACATVLDLSPGAEARLDEARGLLAECGANAGSGVEAGASAWNGHLAIRLLATDLGPLRAVAARLLVRYRGVALPRVWQA